MANKGVQKKKRTTVSNKAVSSEPPGVKCERITKNTSKFSWTFKDLNGKSYLEQSKAIRAKLEELSSADERKDAALSLIEIAGNEGDPVFKIACLIAVKGSGVDLGTVANKMLDPRQFDKNMSMLEKAGIELSDEARDMLQIFCQQQSLDPRMHLIFI